MASRPPGPSALDKSCSAGPKFHMLRRRGQIALCLVVYEPAYHPPCGVGKSFMAQRFTGFEVDSSSAR